MKDVKFRESAEIMFRGKSAHDSAHDLEWCVIKVFAMFSNILQGWRLLHKLRFNRPN